MPWSNRGLIGEMFCMGVVYPVPAAICSLLSKDVEDILVECAGLRTCSESRADPKEGMVTCRGLSGGDRLGDCSGSSCLGD